MTTGPLPLTADAVPAPQRLAVGVLARASAVRGTACAIDAGGGAGGGRQSCVEDQEAGEQFAGEVLNLLGRLPKA